MARGSFDAIRGQLASCLAREPRVVFALLHGSLLHRPDFRDIDVAVLFDRTEAVAAQRDALDLEARLQRASLPVPVDVQPLNGAPATFCHRVIGEGAILRLRPGDGELALAEFTERTIREYLDTEQLRRVIAAGLRAA